jgi:hypothetical protein
MKKLTILLLFVIASIAKQSHAQNLDSLWTVWNNPSQPDTNRLKAIAENSNGMVISSPNPTVLFTLLSYNIILQKKKASKNTWLKH